MDEAYIEIISDKLMGLNADKSKQHEFIIALSDVKAMIENRMAQNMAKSVQDIQIKSMAQAMKGVFRG